MTARSVLTGLAMSLVAMAVVLGLLPVNVGSAECGSSWKPAEGSEVACATAGLTVVRVLSYAFLAGAGVAALFAVLVHSPAAAARDSG